MKQWSIVTLSLWLSVTALAELQVNGRPTVDAEASLVDPTTGTGARVELNGGLAINIQDQTTEVIDLYLTEYEAAATLAASAGMAISGAHPPPMTIPISEAGTCAGIGRDGHGQSKKFLTVKRGDVGFGVIAFICTLERRTGTGVDCGS